jgi:hypothetical protein
MDVYGCDLMLILLTLPHQSCYCEQTGSEENNFIPMESGLDLSQDMEPD